MLLCSCKTYSPGHLDMKVKLDLILKELQNLKLRVHELKSKFNEKALENRNDKIREDSTSRPRNNEYSIIHKIKIDPPTFNGILDPKLFSDWVAYVDYYFDWYKFTEESRVRFARMRLTRSARIY